MFYVTDRENEGRPHLSLLKQYGAQRGRLSYGRSYVRVKENLIGVRRQRDQPAHYLNVVRKENNLWTPSNLFAPEHFTKESEAKEKLLEYIDEQIKSHDRTAQPRLTVFVHGYNTPLEWVTCFGGRLQSETTWPVVVYSWPSQHSFISYFKDECNAEWSQTHFQHFVEFLKSLKKERPSLQLELVAHSMGNRLALSAASGKNDGLFNKLIMCSPDVDRMVAEYQRSSLIKTYSDIVLFICDKDSALSKSSILHGYARLGRPLHLQDKKEFLEAPKDVPHITVYDFTDLATGFFKHSVPWYLVATALSNKDSNPLNALSGVILTDHKVGRIADNKGFVTQNGCLHTTLYDEVDLDRVVDNYPITVLKLRK